MAGLTNYEIEAYLYPRTLDFRGVYSADSIPPALKGGRANFSIICNLSRIGQAGSHLVSIISRAAYVLYIDSFGLPCSTDTINDFFSRAKKARLL